MNSAFKARNTTMNPNHSFSEDDALSQSFHNLSVNSITSYHYLSRLRSQDGFSFNFNQPNSLNHPFPTSTSLVYPQTLYPPNDSPAVAAQEQEFPGRSSAQWDLSGFINYLQDFLSLENPMITQSVFNRVFPCLFELMTNVSGRHLFKKLVASCNEIQLQLIVNKLTSCPLAFLFACESRYGANSVKKLIKVLKGSPMINDIIQVLNFSFFRLMTHDIGFSIILLLLLNSRDALKIDLLYMSTIECALDLAIDKRGSISLRKAIDNAERSFKYLLLDLVSCNAAWLVKTFSGSFVVEHVVIVGQTYFCNKVCFILRGHFVEIAKQKRGSIVVVRCLNSPGMNHVVEDLLACDELWRVAAHKFGQFVIQCALKVTKERNGLLYWQLVDKLQEHIDSLMFGEGRHVLRLLNGEADD